jgi:hypothetical protein
MSCSAMAWHKHSGKFANFCLVSLKTKCIRNKMFHLALQFPTNIWQVTLQMNIETCVGLHEKYLLLLLDFKLTLNVSTHFTKTHPAIKFHENLFGVLQLHYVDRWADRHSKANRQIFITLHCKYLYIKNTFTKKSFHKHLKQWKDSIFWHP